MKLLAKLNFAAQLLALSMLLAVFLSVQSLAISPPTAGVCPSPVLLALRRPPPPQLAHSLILGREVPAITVPGAVLYAVSLSDATHTQVLWQRAAHVARPPASLAKVMSLLLVLEHLRGRDLTELRRVPHAAAAAQQPRDAAVAGLLQGQQLSWAQLLLYAITISAKDATQSLAILVGQEQDENASEDEALKYFVRRMNRRAAELGLRSASFVDPDGWSKKDSISPLDMARLSAFYSASFPQALAWHRQEQINIGTRQKSNTNLLLPHYPEVEGLKTGFTYEAGFNFSASAQRAGWRYIAVIMGLEANDLQSGLRRRAAEAETLLNWGLQNFAPLDLSSLSLVPDEGAPRQTNMKLLINLLNRQSLREALAAISPNIGAYLLPIQDIPDFPRQGLRRAGQTLKSQNLRANLANFRWHLHWNGRGANYGEIWLQPHTSARPSDFLLARFILPEQPRYILPFIGRVARLKLLARAK